MPRQVRRLTDLDIDEISFVDKAANQYAVMAFSKSDQEDQMPDEIYDLDGDPVDVDDLETGDHVIDEDGNEYVYVDDEEADLLDQLDFEAEDDEDGEDVGAYDDDMELVGKGRFKDVREGASLGRHLRNPKSKYHEFAQETLAGHGPMGRAKKAGLLAGYFPGRTAAIAGTAAGVPAAAGLAAGGAAAYNRRNRVEKGRFTSAVREARTGASMGRALRNPKSAYHEAAQDLVRGGAGENWGRARKAGLLAGYFPGRTAALGGIAAGTAAAPFAAGGAVAANRRRGQSDLGKSVYYELSKALNDDDRDTVIAKAMDAVDAAYSEAAEARALAEQMAEQRLYDEWVSKAAEYNVPVDPSELGSLLMNASQTLSKRDIAVLEHILNSSSNVLDELGTTGGGVPSEVVAQFEYLADEMVGKSDLSHAEAMTALFEANPDAYDVYLSETSVR